MCIKYIKTRVIRSAIIAVAALSFAAQPVGAQPCPEDINGDGEVNFVDLLEVLGVWGLCPGCAEDINDDDVVDRNDLALVLSVWGSDCERPLDGVQAHSIKIVDNTSGGAEPPFGPGTTHFTFDLQVKMTEAGSLDNTTSSLAEATLTDPSVSFYQHDPQGSMGKAPEPFQIIMAPAWEFDSYYCMPTVIDPGSTPGGSRSGAMSLEPYIEDPQHLYAMWYSDLSEQQEGGVYYTIARYTLEVPEGFPRPCMYSGGTGGEMLIGTIVGNTTRQSLGAALTDFAFDIIATNCPWDIDRDCLVGFSDLLTVLSNWGPCSGCPEDMDGNDDVGFSDLLEVLSRWGLCP